MNKPTTFSHFDSNHQQDGAKSNPWEVEALEPKVLLSADLMPAAQQITGQIDQPGETDRYELVLTETSYLLFDSPQGDQVQWTLTKNEKESYFSDQTLSPSESEFKRLEAGTYQLSVSGLGDQTSSYTLQIVGEGSAQQLNAESVVEGVLDVAQPVQLFKIELDANHNLAVINDMPSVNGNLQWKIFSPDAEQIVANSQAGNIGFTSKVPGVYWLQLEAVDPQQTTAYQFSISLQENVPQPLELGETYSGSVNRQNHQDFVFAVTEPLTLAHHDLAGSDYDWEITSVLSNHVVARKSDGKDSVRLQQGHYQLRLKNTNDSNLQYTFRLVSQQQAQLLSQATLVTESVVYKISVQDLKTLSVLGDSSQWRWSVTTESGLVLPTSQSFDLEGNNQIELTTGGYYLWVSRLDQNATPLGLNLSEGNNDLYIGLDSQQMPFWCSAHSTLNLRRFRSMS